MNLHRSVGVLSLAKHIIQDSLMFAKHIYLFILIPIIFLKLKVKNLFLGAKLKQHFLFPCLTALQGSRVKHITRKYVAR